MSLLWLMLDGLPATTTRGVLLGAPAAVGMATHRARRPLLMSPMISD